MLTATVATRTAIRCGARVPSGRLNTPCLFTRCPDPESLRAIDSKKRRRRQATQPIVWWRSIVEHSDEAPLFERRIQLSSWACQRDAMRCSDVESDHARNDVRHDDALQCACDQRHTQNLHGFR